MPRRKSKSADELLLEELFEEEDFASMARPLTALDMIFLISGGTPRAGIYRTESQLTDGTILVETKVVNRHGDILSREVMAKASSSEQKRPRAKRRKPRSAQPPD